MNERNVGTIVQVVGPVLDIKFADGHLPNLNNAIHIEHNGKTMTAEVAQHIGQRSTLHRNELHGRFGSWYRSD